LEVVEVAGEEIIAMLVATPLLIGGVQKGMEILYENFMARRGFIKVIFAYLNRHSRPFYVKPKGGNFTIAGQSYPYTDHSDYNTRLGSMPTCFVDSKNHMQLKLFGEKDVDNKLTPAKVDGIGQQSYSLGFRTALKKMVNFDKYFLIMIIGILICVGINILTLSKLGGGKLL
jgi:hypothetical protein